jgi:hypothetical protein
VLSCNKSGSHGSDYTACCLLGYDGIYKYSITVSQRNLLSPLTLLGYRQKVHYTKRHHIPQDSHSGILGEDYIKVSQFLSELLTVVFLLSQQ